MWPFLRGDGESGEGVKVTPELLDKIVKEREMAARLDLNNPEELEEWMTTARQIQAELQEAQTAPDKPEGNWLDSLNRSPVGNMANPGGK